MKRVIALSMILVLITTVSPSKYVGNDVVEPIEEVAIECVVDEPQVYLDIPLSTELQEFTKNQCEYMGVPYEIVIAVMDVESGFQEDVISQTNDVGLMQINVINHKEMNELFGITDMLDAENNIIAGVYMLSVLYNKYEHDNLVLMAYNLGQSKAKSYWERGIYETEYVEKVVNKIGTYGTTERVSWKESQLNILGTK